MWLYEYEEKLNDLIEVQSFENDHYMEVLMLNFGYLEIELEIEVFLQMLYKNNQDCEQNETMHEFYSEKKLI